MPDGPLLESSVADIHTLTPLQRGMLFHAVTYGGDVFVEQLAWTLTGALDTDRLRRAWASAVRRHGALASLVRWQGLTRPYQIVLDATEPVITQRDSPPDSWEAMAAAERAALPDMQDAPPSRLLIVATGQGRWRLIWTLHHILLDGWSAGLFLQDVAAFYDDPERRVAPAPQFSQFTAWAARRATESRAADHAYWETRFRALSGPCTLVMQEPVPNPSSSISPSAKTIRPLLMVNTGQPLSRIP